MFFWHSFCQFLFLSAHFVQHVLRQKSWLQGYVRKRFHEHPIRSWYFLQERNSNSANNFSLFNHGKTYYCSSVHFTKNNIIPSHFQLSLEYQCLHLITACFMCVFHSLKHLPTKLKINNGKKPPPKPAQPEATSFSKPFTNTPAGLRLLRPVPKSAMLVRIAIGGVVGLLIFLICWWVPWHANGVNVEPSATMGVSEACRPGKGMPVHLSKRGAGFDVMKCLMNAELYTLITY